MKSCIFCYDSAIAGHCSEYDRVRIEQIHRRAGQKAIKPQIRDNSGGPER